MKIDQNTGMPEVRAMKLKDRKELKRLLLLFIDKSGNESLSSLIPKAKGALNSKGESPETEPESVEESDVLSGELYATVKTLLVNLFEWIEDDVTKWFMSLIDATEEEYLELDFDIEVHIIEEMCKQRGFRNFFSKASDLFKKVGG